MEITYADKPWLNCYDEGVPTDIPPLKATILDMLEESARKHPTHIALNFKGQPFTYRQLKEETDAIAAGLAANGFKKGDRAVIYMANMPQFVISYFGIMKAGGIVIATNPLYTERELEHQLADCGAETVFVMSRFYPLLKSVQRKGHTRVKRIIVANIKEYFPTPLKILFTLLREKKGGDAVKLEAGDLAFQDFLALGRRNAPPKVEVTLDDIAMLQYTGGTTGLAKGAVGLHRNLAANMEMLKLWLDWQEAKEGFVGSIPFFHSYGMITAMIFSAAIAGTLYIVPDPRNQKDLLSTIHKYKPTLFPGVPAMYIAINNNPDVASGKYDVTSIRACISGSAPLLVETKRRFEELTGGNWWKALA
jgi:long-chain acyl-CoA synthetase